MSVTASQVHRAFETMTTAATAQDEMEAAQTLKDLLNAAADPAAAVGLLMCPHLFGMVEVGRIEWADDTECYYTSVVLTDAAGQLYTLEATGEYAYAENAFWDTTPGQATRHESVRQMEGRLAFAQLAADLKKLPANIGCHAERDAVVARARTAHRILSMSR